MIEHAGGIAPSPASAAARGAVASMAHRAAVMASAAAKRVSAVRMAANGLAMGFKVISHKVL